MELLLGCGKNWAKQITFDRIPKDWVELITLDVDPGAKPSVLHDLNDLHLPFEDDQFDEIHAYEVLEHCGRQGDWRFFFDQFTEFWRILKPGGYFCATVPLWDSMWAWGDPGHSRVISEGSITFLVRPAYEEQVGKTSMTDYRGWYKGDFDVIGTSEEKGVFGFVLQAVKPVRA